MFTTLCFVLIAVRITKVVLVVKKQDCHFCFVIRKSIPGRERDSSSHYGTLCNNVSHFQKFLSNKKMTFKWRFDAWTLKWHFIFTYAINTFSINKKSFWRSFKVSNVQKTSHGRWNNISYSRMPLIHFLIKKSFWRSFEVSNVQKTSHGRWHNVLCIHYTFYIRVLHKMSFWRSFKVSRRSKNASVE